jgi:protein ImuA
MHAAPAMGPQVSSRASLHADFLWRADQLARLTTTTLPTGFAVLDAELPGGGWPAAGLSELLLAQTGCGEITLLAPALARLGTQGSEVLWIAPPHVPFAPALHALGLPLPRFTWVAPATAQEAAWAAEQALRSGTCGAVLWCSDAARADMLRRLHLAALDHACPLWALRPWAAQQHTSPAPLRLACTPLLGRRLSVRIVKRRGPAQALPVSLALPDPVLRRTLSFSSSPTAGVERPFHALAGRSSAPSAA